MFFLILKYLNRTNLSNIQTFYIFTILNSKQLVKSLIDSHNKNNFKERDIIRASSIKKGKNFK